MQQSIPDKILKYFEKIQKADFDVYFVGGCVRDLLLKIPVKDWDFTTNATPQDIMKLFPDSFYDNTFGTVGIPLEIKGQKQVLEITTFRTEQGYEDRRHPTKVSWGKTIEEDLSRRDFTINAIASKFTDDKQEIIDPFDGQGDIKDHLVRAVGDPSKRFKEDALRLMRAIRLSSQLGFKIEEKTWEEIRKDASLIEDISYERIRIEFLKILSSDNPDLGVVLLKDSGILKHIMPELLEGVGVSQKRPGRHHEDDVFTHNLLSLKSTPSKDPIVRFAALIHDVGKPKSMGKDEQGLVIFYNHEVFGAKIGEQIADRFKFSKKEKDKIVTLVRWHMFLVDEKITDAAVRRFIRRIGVGNVKDMMDLRVGDRLGGGTQTAESWRLKLFRERVEDQLKPKPFSIEDMAIDGNDIMKTLNIKPGPRVGEILTKLFEEVDEDLSKNTKDYLLNRIKELN